jgi:hypothetical protein
LRNKSIFQISTLVCLSSISICNLPVDLPTYKMKSFKFQVHKINWKHPIVANDRRC